MLSLVRTRPFQSGPGPLSPGSRAGLGAALVLLAIVSAVELADGRPANYIALMVAAPFLAAALASWRIVLGVGLAATALGTGFALWEDDRGAGHRGQRRGHRAGHRHRGGGRRRSGSGRPSGSPSCPGWPRSPSRPCCARSARRSGTLAVAGRYISATAAADIGGDLYEALDTPYGVRMIIGDVRGKGLDAVRLASIVLGSYRHVAYERADLRAIVADLDRAVARSRRSTRTSSPPRWSRSAAAR